MVSSLGNWTDRVAIFWDVENCEGLRSGKGEITCTALDITEFELPFTQSNGNAKKAVTYMKSSEAQGQEWAGIRNLESTALRMYLNPWH